MSKPNTRFMADHIASLGDVETYGCLPMSIAELMDEFENFAVMENDFDEQLLGPVGIHRELITAAAR